MTEIRKLRVPAGILSVEAFGPFENRAEALDFAESVNLDPSTLSVSGHSSLSGFDYILVLSGSVNAKYSILNLAEGANGIIQRFLDFNLKTTERE